MNLAEFVRGVKHKRVVNEAKFVPPFGTKFDAPHMAIPGTTE